MSLSRDYFLSLQTALHKAGLAEPVLVIDQTRLNRNVDYLRTSLPEAMQYRIVAKSLPSAPLLAHVAKRARTDRLMSFNQLMTRHLLDSMPKADILHGKPLPVAACAAFLRDLPASRRRQIKQIQWLIDTPARLAEYSALAKKHKMSLRLNLEIDVGLHRGGFAPGPDLAAALTMISTHAALELSGFMGYEPHLTKIPDLEGWKARAKKGAWGLYQSALEQAREVFGAAHVEAMTRNMAGSPTIRLYKNTRLANEVAAGSALVKPSDFDTPLLSRFEAASFIATPVLKVAKKVTLPALEFANGVVGEPENGTAIFVHGGYWMASPVFPKGLSYNPIFGRSSNQDFMQGGARLSIGADDFVFLRPHQSEAVFLQFPKIAVFNGRQIVDLWAPLSVSA